MDLDLSALLLPTLKLRGVGFKPQALKIRRCLERFVIPLCQRNQYGRRYEYDRRSLDVTELVGVTFMVSSSPWCDDPNAHFFLFCFWSAFSYSEDLMA